MDVSDVSPTPALCPYVFTLKRPARVALSPDSLPSMHFRRSCYVLPTSRIVRGIVSSSVKWSTSLSCLESRQRNTQIVMYNAMRTAQLMPKYQVAK
mmetsp:Transcript_20423/g.47982  ORF Transcript_20423/g.47982 Transcript_20423/m.47982 type:complete len:96 (-) Transcript_20423:584-871(-)